VSLRLQLLLVSLFLLGLPWAGLQFLKANEQALRTLQQQALESTALAIAGGLNDRWDVLYTARERLTQAPTDNSLQAQKTSTAPVLDGSFDDWLAPQWRQFGTERRPLHIALAHNHNQLAMALRVLDNTKRYNVSAENNTHNGDRLALTLWHRQKRQTWVVSPAAPGAFIQPIASTDGDAAHPLRGYWADVTDGYHLELELPLDSVGKHLGVNYIDVDDGGESYRGNVSLTQDSEPPLLVLAPSVLDTFLTKFNGRSMQISIIDRWGWALGESAALSSVDNTATHGLTQWLYRSILPTPLTSSPSVMTDSGRLITGTAASALQNKASHRLIYDGETLVAEFAAPISSSDTGIIGAVLVEQGREEYLSLTDTAFEGLFYKGSLAMLVVIVALLGYAGFLSLRIVRLNTAVSQGGAITETTHAWLNDEVADLAQQFLRLRGEQTRLEAYLRSLPRALAHEIRTPVAVITSTLENLASAQTDAQRLTLIHRAKSGLARLSAMLNAMNEATRLEASVGSEHYETIDLVLLLVELRDAYESTFPEWSFEVDSQASSAVVSAVPELLVQALDKLIANATSFTQPGETIQMVVEKRGMWWRLCVRNPGPQLPDVGDALFAPMRSIRESQQSGEQHIGLGLYIVSLIAQHHGGEPFAQSTDNPKGAEVGFSIAMQ